MAKPGSRLLAACLVLALIVTGLGAIVRSAYALSEFDLASTVQDGPPVAPPAIVSAEGQDCERASKCHQLFLNVMIRQGDAQLAIANSCTGDWRHVRRNRDVHQTIRQWHDDAVAKVGRSLCIPLPPEISGIRVTSTGGHCGFYDEELITFANEPRAGGTLKPRHGGGSSLKLEGCHAGTSNGEFGTFAYGGIALDFSDGYGFGDFYATGEFYGVYDRHETSVATPLGAAIHAISKLNSYHYRVEILNGGLSDRQQPKSGRADDE